MDIEQYTGIAIIPTIMGLSHIAKQLGFPVKFLPLLSLVLGVGASMLFFYHGNLKAAILQGFYLGLSASGLYSSTKNVTEGIRGLSSSRKLT